MVFYTFMVFVSFGSLIAGVLFSTLGYQRGDSMFIGCAIMFFGVFACCIYMFYNQLKIKKPWL